MNIGLIGLGYWGNNILRNLKASDVVKKIHILDINHKIEKNQKNFF